MTAEKRQNLPDFRLSIDGQDLANPFAFLDITEKVRPRLIGLTLTEKRGGEADQLDIVLDDSDGLLAIPRPKAIIRLSIGWARGSDVAVGLVDKGRFTVDEGEWAGPPDQVTIRARSADLTDAFRVRREKGFVGKTLGAIAREIAAANGLTAHVAPALDGIAVAQLAQHQKSDMALLRDLGRRHDCTATVKDRKLILSPVGGGTTATGKVLPALALTRADGDGYAFRRVERGADAGVEARWHDTDAGERKTVKVGGGAGKPRRLRRTYHSEAEARAAAKAQDNRAKRATAEFDLALALGRADIYPDRPATIAGFKAEADAQKWLVAEVVHAIDQSGFTTKLKLESRA